jgi:hypothetical protein
VQFCGGSRAAAERREAGGSRAAAERREGEMGGRTPARGRKDAGEMGGRVARGGRAAAFFFLQGQRNFLRKGENELGMV